MRSFIKIAPIVVALALVSCKKDQTADQLIIEDEVAQDAAPVIASAEDMVNEAQ